VHTDVTAADVQLAHRLAKTASDIALAYFRRGVAHRSKPDGSPVSDADLEVDAALGDLLARTRPEDGVLSEESGDRTGRSGRRWIIDPIDGTVPYLAGGRAWGAHVALEDQGGLAVAVLTRPTENRWWWAVRGGGAYVVDAAHTLSVAEPLKLSRTARLTGARVGGFVPPRESPAAAAIARHAQWCEDEVSVIAALLEGRLDAVLDEGGNPWDQAPAALLVAEAGGVFADPAGGRRLDAAWLLYGDAAMHAALRPVLAAHLPAFEDRPEGARSAAAT